MPLDRILITVHHYPPRRVGGAELVARRLAQWLAGRGVEVRVVCIENLARGPVTRLEYVDEFDQAVRVRRIDLTIAESTDLALWHDSPILCAHLDELLTEWRPRIVHAMSGYLMGTAPLYAARAHLLPTVVTLPDFWFLCPTIQLLRGDGSLCGGPEPMECARCLYDERRLFRTVDQRAPELMRAFWRLAANQSWLGAPLALSQRLDNLNARAKTLVPALNLCDAIVSPTRFVADIHIANGVNPNKLAIKPLCLDLENLLPAGPRQSDAKIVRFGYLGQITPVKGVHLLLSAFLHAERAANRPIHLDIHGKANAAPSYMTRLELLASQSAHIKFHGAYDANRALQLLDDLDVVIVPSLWYENSPLVILEAFAAKRPVIGTRVGGIAEVVRDDVNGLLFERGNVDDLARLLVRVTNDPLLLPRLAQNIPPPRTMEEDMRDMMAIYDRVLNKT